MAVFSRGGGGVGNLTVKWLSDVTSTTVTAGGLFAQPMTGLDLVLIKGNPMVKINISLID